MAGRTLILGTRGSALALWQAHHVRDRLREHGHDVELVQIRTTGDRILDVPLAEVGDKGLFTKELDEALLDGRIHLAVHSLKDLQTVLPEGVALAAVSHREEPWDAFVAHPSYSADLASLPVGAVIGTSSLRRQAQLMAWRPDLQVRSVRGNVDTRLTKLDASSWHGLVLAAAGLIRLGFEARIRERFVPEVMLPAVSQGALGIVCAADDGDTWQVLRDVLHDPATSAATAAERAFLRRLEGGCSVPVGAWGRLAEDGRLTLDGCVGAVDGSRLLRGQIEGRSEDAETIGRELAEQLLDRGADAILDAIRSRK
jgi:hydroxymethylbilane synthase